jgi:hypothetical protein
VYGAAGSSGRGRELPSGRARTGAGPRSSLTSAPDRRPVVPARAPGGEPNPQLFPSGGAEITSGSTTLSSGRVLGAGPSGSGAVVSVRLKPVFDVLFIVRQIVNCFLGDQLGVKSSIAFSAVSWVSNRQLRSPRSNGRQMPK